MTISPFWILFLCSMAFGGIIGAYFGTADYRVRRDEPLITSRCYCPLCGHPLSPFQQIPVVSWFLLGGRCYYCHEPVPVRYPLIEGGFLAYYGVSFCVLWGHPLLAVVSWFLFVCALLLWRCDRHYRSMAKALAVFAGYHGVYGLVFFCVYAATQTI